MKLGNILKMFCSYFREIAINFSPFAQKIVVNKGTNGFRWRLISTYFSPETRVGLNLLPLKTTTIGGLLWGLRVFSSGILQKSRSKWNSLSREMFRHMMQQLNSSPRNLVSEIPDVNWEKWQFWNRTLKILLTSRTEFMLF